jgi:hypothetical protein
MNLKHEFINSQADSRKKLTISRGNSIFLSSCALKAIVSTFLYVILPLGLHAG